MPEKRKAVVTGGAGFIGSHIADELVRRGYETIILDNLSTGRIENIQHLVEISRYKIQDTTNNPETSNKIQNINKNKDTNGTKNRVNFIKGSITDTYLLQELFQGVDYVFHQAAIPSVPRSVANPVASHETNITGTLNVLIAARDNKVKKVVYASSSSVYGDTPTLPKREDMIPNPLSPYAVNKLAAEYYCRVFNTVYQLPTVCLRYFNVYGPRQDPNSQYAAVIPKFITSIMEGKPPVIFGDGEQSRDFTYIKDVVEANLLAAEDDAEGVYNLGRGERITLNELTGMMLKILNRDDLKPIYQQERAGDIKHSLADIHLARSFGYDPKYSVEMGLRETVESFRC